MSLKDQISSDVKSALKQGEKQRVSALRFILAAIKQLEIDNRIELDEPATIAVLTKLANQRKESIAQFTQAQRGDLVEKERYELGLIEAYLPPPLSEAEVDTLLEAAITAVNATSAKDMGKVMSHLKPQLVGRADLSKVSNKVKTRLSS